MKSISVILLIAIMLVGCVAKKDGDNLNSGITPMAGTWKLLTGELVEKGDTVVTDYTKIFPSSKLLIIHILPFYNMI
jgi:hypothetical protein